MGPFRKKLAAFAAAAALALGVGMLTAGSASAASVNLSGTAYPSKTYHSVPHYKAATGGASISGVNWTPVPSACGGGGLKTGFRSTSAVGTGELTQFPNSWPSATYRNVEAPPAYNLTFSGGMYYYWNSQMVSPGQASGCAATWSGTVTW